MRVRCCCWTGKSTIFKNMKILYKGGYSDQERAEFTLILYSNALMTIRTLLTQRRAMEIPWGSPDNEAVGAAIEGLPVQTRLTAPVAAQIQLLWKDDSIQATYVRRAQFQLVDSAKYLLENVHRFAAPGFVPTEQDILRSRVKTSGIIETEFDIDKSHFRMVDVGGQRTERRKWCARVGMHARPFDDETACDASPSICRIHAFDNATAVIFVVSLAEYDQVLLEDASVNRMHESLSLFEEIANSRWFSVHRAPPRHGRQSPTRPIR